jgi:YYY domain-containing protein
MEVGLVLAWLGLYLALLYAGGTLGTALFPRAADRGASFGVPVALAVIWLVTYIVGRVSLGIGIWLGLAVLAGLTAYIGRRREPLGRRSFGEAAVVFSAAFLLLVAIRGVDPSIVPIGGEKFLDFGLLKSLLRAETLPPEDMWFAGESVAYYYGGHLVAAILATLTGTAGRFAYNLALAGFYAMLVTAAYGLAGSIAAQRGLPRRLAGAGTAFFAGIASNLSTPGRFLLWLLPDGIATPLGERFGLSMDGLAAGPAEFSYWDASRVITDDAGDFATYDPSAAFVIDEFPFFAWLNGDMHAHMMSTAFLLLVAAVLLAYTRTPQASVRRRQGLIFGVVPAVGGLIAVVNTWSFPAVGGLTVLTLLLSEADPRSMVPGLAAGADGPQTLKTELGRLGTALELGVAVLGIGVLWSLPFWLGAASGREVAVLPDRSSLGELLAVHGLFVAVFVPYLYSRLVGGIDKRSARLAVAGFGGVVVLTAFLDLAAVGLFVPFIIAGWLVLRGPAHVDWIEWGSEPASEQEGRNAGQSTGGVGFETVLIVAGAGLVTLVEFVFIAENVGRMNTVFKTYMQAWVLWAVAGGVGLAAILDDWPRPSVHSQRLTRGFAALLIISTALYAGLALSQHFSGDLAYERTEDPTLDGLVWMSDRHPDEAQAIHWLDRSVAGTPTIVTAAPGGYHWNPSDGDGASAPASLTGIPTVLGWHHERQYRNGSLYEDRLGDVETVYTGSSPDQVAVLERYDVRYVYVGPAERARYGAITVQNVSGVSHHQQFGAVSIYQVNQTALGE